MDDSTKDKQEALDRRYIRMASIWAENSYCQRRQVGALIVKDKMIISDGYNGTPSGFENVCEDENNVTKPYVLHAEANAITKIARSNITPYQNRFRMHHIRKTDIASYPENRYYFHKLTARPWQPTENRCWTPYSNSENHMHLPDAAAPDGTTSDIPHKIPSIATHIFPGCAVNCLQSSRTLPPRKYVQTRRCLFRPRVSSDIKSGLYCIHTAWMQLPWSTNRPAVPASLGCLPQKAVFRPARRHRWDILRNRYCSGLF